MEGLQRIEQDIYAIRDRLYTNKIIAKLLYYSDSNALKGAYVDRSQIDNHIFVSPVFDTTKEPFNKHTFISITVANTEWDDEDSTHLAAYRINVFSKIELWELDDERVRPLTIASEIIKILDQIKLKSSHKLFYISADLTVLNNGDMAGYTLLFGIQDGGGDSDAVLY